ncbi:2-dehydropantoate 2-reductase [Candidatus Photodesmus katoptron]|uniref:2-dehydropantoate 2-reductase n=1 Tax=Candidatus Photodesmus katoptron Akat1 TaxID=1236703 RepID=S3DJI9_9GAMM|nr:2-dehydropantoate 2-reductase [Candidatus Photodesmus katoptron]EPE37870.1 2-dehydropantoate 2-reductase [Candidatus Photodesmus katoptron Akat1]KEY90411.1 2-dehydropantoate 2-reductase [Candidatus Photodesmus katoptron]
MNISIIGPGAIGTLLACRLVNSGHHVSIWGKSLSSTISLRINKEQPHLFSNCNKQHLANSELIIITVKAWQVENALVPIVSYLHKDCIIVFMHNGMGVIEHICNKISHHPILLATTTHGVYKPNSMQVFHTGKGITKLGGYNDKGKHCVFLVKLLDHALPEVIWSSSIKVTLWNKLAISCVINPITALEQCANGILFKKRYEHLLINLLNEIVLVMHEEGIETNFFDLSFALGKTIKNTEKNFSSMQQDVFFQRKTEIDFITGYLISKAEKHGILVPKNRFLYQKIKLKEGIYQK